MSRPRSALFSCAAGIAGLILCGSLGASCSVDERHPTTALPLEPAATGGNVGGALADAGPVSSRPTVELAPLATTFADTPGEIASEPVLLTLGQSCSAQTAPCEPALRCVDGSCRLPCVTAGDCVTLGSQVMCNVGAALDGSGVGACSYQSYCDPAHPAAPHAAAKACAGDSGCSASESGESACQPQLGAATAGGECVSDLNCAPGYFCGSSGTCRQYCLDDSDCPGQVCSPFAPPRRAGDLAVGFCAGPACDPVHPQTPRDGLSACAVGSGCTPTPEGQVSVCNARNADAGVRYASCAQSADCRPELVCISSSGSSRYCGQFCYSDADCGRGRCKQFEPQFFAGSFPVGSCFDICNPLNPTAGGDGFSACPAGFTCVATNDGFTTCQPGGTQQRYERCTVDTCSPGMICGEGPFAFCSPQCQNDADCGSGRCRASSLRSGDAQFGTCAEVCNPVAPQSNAPPFTACPTGFACTPDPSGASQCILLGNGRFGADCSSAPDSCASGFGCSGDDLRCHQMCFVNGDCQSGRCGLTFNPPVFADTRALRGCEDP